MIILQIPMIQIGNYTPSKIESLTVALFISNLITKPDLQLLCLIYGYGNVSLHC
jgi:hypothetical protein